MHSARKFDTAVPGCLQVAQPHASEVTHDEQGQNLLLNGWAGLGKRDKRHGMGKPWQPSREKNVGGR